MPEYIQRNSEDGGQRKRVGELRQGSGYMKSAYVEGGDETKGMSTMDQLDFFFLPAENVSISDSSSSTYDPEALSLILALALSCNDIA